MRGSRKRVYHLIEKNLLTLGCFRADRTSLWKRSGRIIFVCSGNICRSPYAEEVARGWGLQAISCGTNTDSGLSADAIAVEEAAKRGVDLTRHETMRWPDVPLHAGDVVLAMQLRHVLTVLGRARIQSCRVSLFGSLLLPQFAPISDPYGRPRDEYRRVFALIEAGIRRIVHLKSSAAE